MRSWAFALSLGILGLIGSCQVRNYDRCRGTDAPCLPGFFCDCSNMTLGYGVCVASMPDGFLACGSVVDTDMMTDGPPPMGCTDSSQCTDSATPICRARVCASCMPSDDGDGCRAHNPLKPRCDGTGRCVACLPGATAPESADCGAAMPICAGGICRLCQSHSECSSGVCKSDGSCASANDVLYVDNNVGKGCQTTGPGTKAMPYCEVQPAALAAVLSAKPFVVVAGSVTAYTTAINLTATTGAIGPLTIVGPGRAAAVTAKVQPSVGAPAVLVNASGNAATVTVDGLELVGTGTSPGVRCSIGTGAGSFTLQNSLVRGSPGVGVESSGCKVDIDSSVITLNAGGGVKLTSTNYTVTNTIISANGSMAASSAGVSFDNSSTGTFAFNTVVFNTVMAGVGGIDCGTGTQKPILNSIVWKNTTASGTQLGAQCALTNVVTVAGDDNRGSMSAMAPSFVSATDFHLTPNSAANTACCVDKITSPTTPNRDNDIDGVRRRPKGAAWDIGAHEVE